MNLPRSTNLLSAACVVLSLAACSSDDDGFSYDPIPYNQIPADAIVVTESNAVTVSGEGYSTSTDDTYLKSGTDTLTTAISAKANVDQFIKQSPWGHSKSSEIVLGVTYSEPCESGQMIFTGDNTGGTITWDNCRYGSVTANGILTASETYNSLTQMYTSIADGGLTISDPSATVSMGVHVRETYSDIDPYPYSLDMNYAITGIPGIGGFMFETVTDITGDYSTFPFYPDSGQVIISGANSTRIRITFFSDDSMSLEVDNGLGTFVAHPSSPIYNY